MSDTNEGFVRMDGAEADKACGVRKGFVSDNCPVCKNTVILHCPNCKVQVSGCQCLMEERVASGYYEIDATEQQVEREERLRAQLASRGMWLPPV